eukprot:TRINITY_DN1214_c0_g1_i5.p1 TRINITY_DN1214_c0_g1~~TRINITY_DN1214_c0_g1_i5.p1  ORF type:complete len:764 (-),score=92.74 TRINITY_DN1214_c0_g1_i5:31-2322(-)
MGRSTLPVGPRNPLELKVSTPHTGQSDAATRLSGEAAVATPGTISSSSLYCSLCKINLRDQAQREVHLTGKKHLRRKQQVMSAAPSTDPLPLRPPRTPRGTRRVLPAGIVSFIPGDKRAKSAEMDYRDKKRARVERESGTGSRFIRVWLTGWIVGKCTAESCNCTKYEAEATAEGAEQKHDKDPSWVRQAKCVQCSHGAGTHLLEAGPLSTLQNTDTEESGDEVIPLFALVQSLGMAVKNARTGCLVFPDVAWVLPLLEQVCDNAKKIAVAHGHTRKKTTTTDEPTELDTMVENMKEHTGQIMQILAPYVQAENASNDDNAFTIQTEHQIQFVSHLDLLYFWLYNHAAASAGRFNKCIPDPVRYFTTIATPMSASLSAAMHRLLETLEPTIRDQYLSTICGGHQETLASFAGPTLVPVCDENSSWKDNDLLCLYRLRQQETALLISTTQFGAGLMDSPPITGPLENLREQEQQTEEQEDDEEQEDTVKQLHAKHPSEMDAELDEPPCHPVLQLWRNACRDWLTHIYSYAVPTTEALDAIAAYAPIIEIGAGAGYWTNLLRQRLVNVMAYDIIPPVRKGTAWNEYHGRLDAFTDVLQGDTETARLHPDHALLLCYPPPADRMALRCLQAYTGQIVLYVGEWQGDTANLKFEEQLSHQFTLQKRVPLPNWGNTAYELTIWKRGRAKRRSNKQKAQAVFKCASCEQNRVNHLKRCVYCAQYTYCSQACVTQHQDAHNSIHAIHGIFLTRPLDFNQHDFVQLASVYP